MSRSDERRDGPAGEARVLTAQRDQVALRVFDVNALIAEDHRARMLWAAVEQMDLRPFYDEIRSRTCGPGADALDPKVLLALWLYATSEAVRSARQLARLCERDHAYMWICGGLTPNYHNLSDSRGPHGGKIDTLLTEVLAS